LASPKRALIVAADRETARFFIHARPGASLESHGSAIERPSPGDRTADRPGRAFESAGEGRHAMEPPTSYQDQERQEMARAIRERVDATFHADAADRLVLIVEPQLLGELRQTLAKPIRDRVVLEIDSHLTQADVDELARRLDDDGTLGLVRY
jgi:protein required for attachment to host cells